MSESPPLIDLVVLTADNNAQFAIRGILSRDASLAIRQVTPDYFVHPQKDPGIIANSHEFLRPFVRSHGHALVVMDREGSGRGESSREELEQEIEKQLRRTGWHDRAAAVVIDPELDIWVWSESPHVQSELGWGNRQPNLRSWMRQQGLLDEGKSKPARPKEALEAALYAVRIPRSSAVYRALAEKVSLSNCIDPAFLKLKKIVQTWFSK